LLRNVISWLACLFLFCLSIPDGKADYLTPPDFFKRIDLKRLSRYLPPVSIHRDESFLDLVPNTFYYQQKNPNLTWENVKPRLEEGSFRKDFRFSITQSGSDASIWQAVLLRVEGETPRTMVLEHAYASHVFQLLHVPEQEMGRFYDNGARRLNVGKVLLHSFPYESIELKPGLNLILVRVETQVISLSLNLHSEDHFLETAQFNNIRIAFFMSGLAMVLIYNVVSFLTTRNRENGLYALYITTMITYNLWAQGIGSMMFGEFGRAFIIKIGASCLVFSVSFLTYFVLAFFDIKRRQPPLVYRVCMILAAVNFCSAILSVFYVNYTIIIATALPLVALITIMAIKLGLERFRPAVFFLVSFSPLAASLAFMAFSYFSNVNIMSSALDLLTAGILLEAALLGVAIGDKFAITLREKNKKILLESNSRLHAFSQLEKMVYPHQIAQIKAGVELEKTMATGHGEACVIAFDIVESSKIDHALAKEFFRNLFRACNEAMMRGYDGSYLRARAYRIKEMGDGFLCSVGYPFAGLSGNIANDALELALEFVAILEREAAILQPDEPICCGVGIALGSISGFFPETGTKEYDLHGPGIVLATRYEAMRKTIFPHKLANSVVILQERVHKSIDKALRSDFQIVDLAPDRIVVRDDPGAQRLYYRLMGTNDQPIADDKASNSQKTRAA
jgi:class 3 adenylate cyclase